MSEYDKKRRDKAKALNIDVAMGMVSPEDQDGRIVFVNSFTTPNVVYKVTLNEDRRVLLSCTCPDHEKHRLPCKHIYLANRVRPAYIISYRPAPTEAAAAQAVTAQGPAPREHQNFYLNLEDLLAPETVEGLETMRAEKNERRKREMEERDQECEEEIDRLMDNLKMHVIAKAKRQCTLRYKETFATSLKSLVFDAKGLNDREAGHKCQ
ncbi:hypothetical protein BGX20_004610 [Mortierella sp. AD010]|nr:hypothetical protein BGX20_004610 [Mortierella sp. AD010]